MHKHENIAILMADLSGYTALTEMHGAISAADLIDRYIGIVKDSLVGDSKIAERVGDEVMIVSSSPENLFATARRLMKSTSNEENFLQVHGGLHYGEILKRNDSYFGTTINLAARIAAKASAGTFWCSSEFINQLTNMSLLMLNSKGKHSFKNISEEKEVFELVNENFNSFPVDPVCKMQILDKSKAIKHPGSTEHFFCSHGCLHSFIASQAGASVN
jgi:adenylate cyclase